MLLPQCPHLCKMGVQGAESRCICSRAAPSDGHPQEPELGMLNVLGLPGVSLPSPCSPEQVLGWRGELWISWVGLGTA